MLRQWNTATRGWDDLFDGMSQLRNLMDAMLEAGPADGAAAQRLSFFGGAWPQINVADEGARLVVTAQVPGLAREDLKLTLADDVLTLRGERKLETPEGYAVHRREREAQRFTRSISLPCHVNADSVSASLREGVLTVSMDKAEHAKPRQIAVQSSS